MTGVDRGPEKEDVAVVLVHLGEKRGSVVRIETGPGMIMMSLTLVKRRIEKGESFINC